MASSARDRMRSAGMRECSPQLLKKVAGEFDLANIFVLDLSGLGLTTLTGTESCCNLEVLLLGDNRLTGITALAGLTRLRELACPRNEIAVIAPKTLPNSLVRLALEGNQISDPGALAAALDGCRGLEVLSLQKLSGQAANPVCASPAYTRAVHGALPNLKILDGRRLDEAFYSDYEDAIKEQEAELSSAPDRAGPVEPMFSADALSDILEAGRKIDQLNRRFDADLQACQQIIEQAQKSPITFMTGADDS
eukprot:m.21897 g.21897  ORF g.21897 m.21897 type:complete len:251 (+) comp3964_c0_seq1:116-868(+)